SIHRLVGNMFWNGYSITVGNTACVYRDITSSLDNLVECAPIYHQVADNRETGRTPRLYSDGVSVVEFTHVELASSDIFIGSVRMSVDIEAAHSANAFA